MSQAKRLTRADRKQINAAIANAKRQDKRHKSAQDSIPFQRMFPDGICRVTDNYYTKTVQFQDINYQLNQNEDKTAMPIAVEKSVVVNHAGSVITAKPLDLTDKGRLYFTENSGVNFVGGYKTVSQFIQEQKKDRNTEEVEAESISFAVCAYYGIETGENSFGYIAGWSQGKELPELRASLETINKTSSGLITDIDRHYAEICKERGLDMTAEQDVPAESLADSAAQEPEPEQPVSDAHISPTTDTAPITEITVQEPAPVSAPDNGCVPDPAISVESMNAYGYTDTGMLPLTKERALELMERDVTVYMLHSDNTEAMAFDAEEIQDFEGIFGIAVEDWKAIQDTPVTVVQRPDYEKAFLDSSGDAYAVYQLRRGDENAELRFMNMDYLDKKGYSVEHQRYEAVYAGALEYAGDTHDKLNGLYTTFNINHPADFTGHSLSVSDIVALKQNGVVSCHYVDSWGFKELPGFLPVENYLKAAELSTEDDYGMIDGIINNGKQATVAELEQQAKSGQPISLLALAEAVHQEEQEKRSAPMEPAKGRPSVLSKLRAPAATKPTNTAPKKSAEREL